jgi:hypothetical protein
MFTITMIRAADTCEDCHAIGSGVEFVLASDPQRKAFLCWKHFRMTLEAMRVASLLPVGGEGPRHLVVDGSTETPHRSSEHDSPVLYPGGMHDGSGNRDSVQRDFLHGETKGGTDGRETGGES